VQFSRRRENLPFSVHAEVAALAPKDQVHWLRRVEANDLSVADLRVALRVERRASAGPLPGGKFRVVYADPPWSYDNDGVIKYGPAARHYMTMSVEEIAALRVRDHVGRDAVLFLWVPTPHLVVANAVIQAWGFAYRTSLVWNKQRHVYGHYVSVQHEHLLIGVRGDCTPDRPVPMPASVVTIRAGRHSEKPAAFRELIDQLYPFGRRVELFARGRLPEPWIAWGDQAERAA
jgi:N6-adenosine-specific RNA methylase IME4